VPNGDGRLFPGSYAQVHFRRKRSSSPVVCSGECPAVSRGGPRAAVVGADGKIHLKPVTIGRDYGTEVEILGGLDPNESIVLNPSDSLEEGQAVNVVKATTHS